MATTATLATLRSRALDAADLTNSSSPVTARLTEYVNDGISSLHDMLVNSFEDYYRSLSNISVVSGTAAYSLPSDFYKVLKVFALSGSQRYQLKRFQLDELDVLQDEFIPYARQLSNMTYRVLGSQIWFAPEPNASGAVELWYAPQATVLSGDGDTVTVYAPVSWWEEYVSLYAAVKLKVRERTDPGPLMMLLQKCEQRIMSAAQERDAGEPQRVTDTSHRFGRYRRRMIFR